MVKIEAIEAAVLDFLPNMMEEDQNHWLAIRQAVIRAREGDVAQGLSGESVRIGINDLPPSQEVSMEEIGDEEEGTSPRRSSHRSVKADKSRAVEGGEKGDTEESLREDEVEIIEELDNATVEEEGGSVRKEPQEKLKASYMRYDASRHFYWAKAVRRMFYFISSCADGCSLVRILSGGQLDLFR